MSRVILSSYNSVLSLLEKNPTILTVPSLRALAAIRNEKDAKSCNCKGGGTKTLRQKALFENILVSITPEDAMQIKSILRVDQLCYYIRDEKKKFQLKCL